MSTKLENIEGFRIVPISEVASPTLEQIIKYTLDSCYGTRGLSFKLIELIDDYKNLVCKSMDTDAFYERTKILSEIEQDAAMCWAVFIPHTIYAVKNGKK